MFVTIYRSCRHNPRYVYSLRSLDRKSIRDFRYFNTIKEIREYAQEKGYQILERPDLYKKWNEKRKPKKPMLNYM